MNLMASLTSSATTVVGHLTLYYKTTVIAIHKLLLLYLTMFSKVEIGFAFMV